MHATSFFKKYLLLNEEEESLFKELAFKSKEELIDIMTKCSLEYRAIERHILESSEIEYNTQKTKAIHSYLQKLKIINLVFESFTLQEKDDAHHQPDTQIRNMLNERTLLSYEKE